MRKSGMVAILLLLAAACSQSGGHRISSFTVDADGPASPAVDLVPNDGRPLYAIEVGDDIEAALVQERLAVPALRLDGKVLYFHDGAGDVVRRVRDFGYTVSPMDPYRVYRRVVRVTRRGEEQELRRMGVQLINREPGHWVVSGELGSLRALAAADYALAPIAPNEPQSRFIRVTVPTPEQADEVAQRVSVYAARQRPGFIELAAEAFDVQIDDLIAAGFDVQRMEVQR